MRSFLSFLLAIPLWPIVLVGAALFALFFPIAWVYTVLTEP